MVRGLRGVWQSSRGVSGTCGHPTLHAYHRHAHADGVLRGGRNRGWASPRTTQILAHTKAPAMNCCYPSAHEQHYNLDSCQLTHQTSTGTPSL